MTNLAYIIIGLGITFIASGLLGMAIFNPDYYHSESLILANEIVHKIAFSLTVIGLVSFIIGIFLHSLRTSKQNQTKKI